MIRVLLVAALVARAPRFLGPPIKADAGVPDAGDTQSGTHSGEADPPLLHPGDDAPMFSGVLHNPEAAGGRQIDLSNMVGSDAEQPAKAVLISFFATWCNPCKKEMPLLQQLSTEYKEKGLRVVSVAIDKDESTWPQIARLVAENQVTYPIVKDRYNLIARRYLGDKTALPAVFIVDKDGKIALVKQGYETDAAEFLRAEVEKVLK